MTTSRDVLLEAGGKVSHPTLVTGSTDHLSEEEKSFCVTLGSIVQIDPCVTSYSDPVDKEGLGLPPARDNDT